MATEKEYVLGADIGSGSVKLTLLSRKGEIRGSTVCEYPTFYPQVGFCEQDPEDWCRAFGKALLQLKEECGIDLHEIRAISPDAATHTAVLLDREKKVIRRAILWTDQRSKKEVLYLKENHFEIIRERCLNAPTTVWTLPQMMWLKENEPENWAKVEHIIFAKDYLRYCLTGIIETDTIDAAGSMFYDVNREAWDEELCRIGGIDPRVLPPLRAPSDLAGKITPRAAQRFGLSPETQIFMGTTDTVMEVLAAGNTRPGHATVKLATAGRICVISPDKLDSQFIFNYRHVIPGLWYPGTGTASCANSYRWYRDQLGKDSYRDLDQEAEKIPAGSEGLMFHPYLNGELTPYNDPELRGSFTGISAGHKTAHFTRATMEGVAFSLRDCLEHLKALGVMMERVRIIGGGAKGPLWRQIVSDVLNLSVEKVEVDDSSFGSALLAAVGMGWFSSYDEACEKTIRIESVTSPKKENSAVYDALYPKYKAIHDALAPIYHGKI